jgi:integrase
MPIKSDSKLPRGVYERTKGSRIHWIRFTDVNGKPHREKAGSKSSAVKLLTLRHCEKLQGKLSEKIGIKKRVLFSDLINDAIRYEKAQNDPYHAHDLELKLERVRSEFGMKDAATITKSQIIDWLASEKQARNWEPSTRNRYQAAFSVVFRVAVDNNKLSRNPAAGILRLREDNQTTRFLSPAEEEKLSAIVQARFPQYLPVFQLAVHTGTRTSELLRSQVGDFDAQTGKLRVRQRKVRYSSAFRYVPLTPIAIAAYEKLAAGKKPGDLLCSKIKGGSLHGTRYWFDPCVKQAGLVNLTWKAATRHTAASRWVMAGVPIAAATKFLGHGTIEMTMRYAHLQPENNDRAVAAMMSFYPAKSGNPCST